MARRTYMFRFLYQFADNLRHQRRKRLWKPALAAGRRGEDLAHRYLQKQGFLIVARNYRARSGVAELDIVAREGETLVFVEVKSRTTDAFGSPDRAVGPDKRDRLFRGAADYLRRAGADWSGVRFDIVNVVLSTPLSIQHIRDVFPVMTAR